MTFPHTATQHRKVKEGTKYVFAPVAGTIKCFLQPLDEAASLSFGIAFTKGSHCYIPMSSDVKEGDRLEIFGNTYGVKGIRIHSYSRLRHKRAIVEQV